MELNNESKTLFIPLIGKALMSKKKVFLDDYKAEEIVSKIDNDLVYLKQSKWLSMYMSLRAMLIDELCNNYLLNHDNTVVIHLGCGLDSRCLRVKNSYCRWYDVDFESVINVRKEFYDETSIYKMIGKSVLDYSWLDEIVPSDNILIVAEGLTMYLSEEEISELLFKIDSKFINVHLIFDAYTRKGVRLSKIKNPVNKVKAKIKYGFNYVNEFLSLNRNLRHVSTCFIENKDNDLKGFTKFIFNNLYCGKMSKSLYKIYEFVLDDK